MLSFALLAPGMNTGEEVAAQEFLLKNEASGHQASDGGDHGMSAATTGQNESRAESPQTFSAEELQDLSQRAEEPGREVIGGALSNLHLTYIVIALATAVIVLIATK